MAANLLEFTGSKAHSRPPAGQDKTKLKQEYVQSSIKVSYAEFNRLVTTYMSQSFS